MMSPSTSRRALSSMNLVAVASTSTLVSSLLPFASAFSFNIDNTPTQCGKLSISITGSGGTPPYRALILPFGTSPLSNAVEVRKIIDQKFDDDATSTSFQLNYPALSQFVVVVSDSQEFGSGGTSSAASVVDSDDSSCFNASATTSVTPSFYYHLDPDNQFVQCTTSRIWWDPSTVEGTPTFYGVIPGGDSFNITFSNTTQKTNEGTGFDWIPPIRGGTTLMIGAGDNRGLGSGGSVTYIVSSGNSNSTCLNSDSPSSTAGSPAGGSYPTSTAEAENSNSSSSSNAGPIAGGVVAALVVICAFVLVLVFLRRRKKQATQNKEKPDLFMDNERPASAQDGEIARLAPPEPYIVPSEPAGSEWGAESSVGVPTSSYGYGIGTGAAAAAAASGRNTPSAYDRRHSIFSDSTEQDHLRPGTPQTMASGSMMGSSMMTGSGRKGAPPVLRPVNIIQHEDAGAPPPADADPETIELPPAYTNIRQG